ncbi:MAG: M1 family metallopeptidase [Nanopusillaceae archaeon]
MRLPDDVKPIKYMIKIDVDIDKLTYSGEEEIILNIEKPRNKIYINSREIKIEKIRFNNYIVNFKELDQDTIEIDIGKKYSGEGKLYIRFKGKVRNDLIGFYLSKGKDKILTTQFEPTYARYFIPCFDEPSFKAKFELEVSVKSDYDVISNTEIKEEEVIGDKKIVKFKETPPMSTYLLYLGIGKFYYLEDKYINKKIRIVADKEKVKDGEFSLDWTKKVLEFYERYSSIDYPLEKLDLIAIPDFAAGAMENWGAITFRETALLYKEENYSFSQKIRTMEVIAHELWHQWSGNLVTMKWWDDLWLNESFATYMAYKAVDQLYEEKIAWERFYINESYESKFSDGFLSTHSIKVNVEKEEEIESIFDEISYGKGGNILRMIDNFLGYDKFRLSIMNYLNKYKYSNASANDLFKEFEIIGGKEIRNMIDRWINKKGYPIVEVNYNKDIIYLNQSRFLYKRNENSKWIIPIFLEIENEKLNILFNKGKGKIILKRKPEYFTINRDAIGFYITKYNNMEFIINGLKNNKFSPLSRGLLLHDLYLLSIFGKISIDRLLDFIDYYRNEDSWFVLTIIFNILYNIYLYFGLEQKEFLNKYLDIFDKFKDIEVKDYSTLNKKYLSFKYLSLLNNYSVIDYSFDKFKEWENINNNEKTIISEVVGMQGGINEFKKMLYLYNKTNNPEEKIILIKGLSSFRRRNLIVELLDKAIDGTIKLQDWRHLFINISRNPESIYVLFSWIKENIDEIKKYEKAYLIIKDIIFSLFNIYTGPIIKEMRDYLIRNLPRYKNDILKFYQYSEAISEWVNKNKKYIEEIL